MWCDPKYRSLYCKKNLPDNLLPRCPLLEKVFNDCTSCDDIFYPPNLTKPPQPKNHREYRLAAIGQLINVLNLWVKEDVSKPELLCFYAYSYGPCKLRATVGGLGSTIGDLITEFSYTHPQIGAELRECWDDLVEKAIEWDKSARVMQTSQSWVDPSHVDPIEVKRAAARLLHKLRHVGSIVKEEQESAEPAKTEHGKGGQGNGGEADSAKEQTAGTWYLRLYEITLKVLVDAVLERVWPKCK